MTRPPVNHRRSLGVLLSLTMVIGLASACAPTANERLSSYLHGTWDCTTSGSEGPQTWQLKVSGSGWRLMTHTQHDEVGTSTFKNGTLTLEVPDLRDKTVTHRYSFGKVSLKDKAVTIVETIRKGNGPFKPTPWAPGRFFVVKLSTTVTMTTASPRPGITRISCTKH